MKRSAMDDSSSTSSSGLEVRRTKPFKKRKETVMRKAMQLSTLCEVSVAAVVISRTGQIETFPENKTHLESIIEKYRRSSSSSSSAAAAAAAAEDSSSSMENQLADKIADVDRMIQLLKTTAIVNVRSPSEVTDVDEDDNTAFAPARAPAPAPASAPVPVTVTAPPPVPASAVVTAAVPVSAAVPVTVTAPAPVPVPASAVVTAAVPVSAAAFVPPPHQNQDFVWLPVPLQAVAAAAAAAAASQNLEQKSYVMMPFSPLQLVQLQQPLAAYYNPTAASLTPTSNADAATTSAAAAAAATMVALQDAAPTTTTTTSSTTSTGHDNDNSALGTRWFLG